jgi:hypothetical protein
MSGAGRLTATSAGTLAKRPEATGGYSEPTTDRLTINR